MNALVSHNVQDMATMADAIARSGLFGMKTPEQALALMLVAQAEGQHPATITQDYDIIQGKACRKTHSVMARFQQMGGKVEWHTLTDGVAEATFSHPQGGSLRIAWTFEQAKKAGLTGKDNWRNYPRAMLRARCIAEGIRAVYPAAIGGMMVSEEAQDAPPRDMGAADVVSSERAAERPVSIEQIPDYPAEAFAANLPKWHALIDKGRSADEIIATVETKGRLTAQQKCAIRRDDNVIQGEAE